MTAIVGAPSAVGAIAVVVPAHDESATIDECLDALEAAAQHPGLRDVPVQVLVVLDHCRDDTKARAMRPRWMATKTIEVSHRNVGRARHAGFARVIADAGTDRSALWLATTDADSTVPCNWFVGQLAWRAKGIDALAGTVRVDDWSAHPGGSRLRFEAHQARLGLADGHGHVHGANLSFSAEAYGAVGGMPARALAEDQILWRRMQAAGLRTVAAGDLTVTTSARRDGRAPGGFSAFLGSLAEEDRHEATVIGVGA